MKEKIYELRLKGKSINQIVDELDCAKSTVSYHLKTLGLGGDISSITNDFKSYNQVLLLKNSGFTNTHIFENVDLSRDKILKILRSNKLNNCSSVLKYRTLDEKKVREYYLQVRSLIKTAKFFNISKYKTKKVVKDLIVYKPKQTTTERKENQKKKVIDWRRRQKEKLVEYKGGKCEKCGYNKSIQALQFHHLNPEEKDFSISGKSYSFERMKKEVDKCIMVCANCHIEIHENEILK